MPGKNTRTWIRAFLQRQKSPENASYLRLVEKGGLISVVIGDVDLPAFVSSGILYIQAPLPHIFKAFAQDLSDELRGMEVRVSTEGGPALSLDGDGRPVYREGMAFPSLVSDSGFE
jgi:hypothetical protein